ncbi:hypothetical protein BC832DRAFT_3528 [Gaertneriomyces semiglobifer]|nr:hypothetical protein BC832DRAFT_3528 [Gaertneriomyces semiglobifer]
MESTPWQLVWRSPKYFGSYAYVQEVVEEGSGHHFARTTIDSSARLYLEERMACALRQPQILKLVPRHPHLASLRTGYNQANKTVLILRPFAQMDLARFLLDVLSGCFV